MNKYVYMCRRIEKNESIPFYQRSDMKEKLRPEMNVNQTDFFSAMFSCLYQLLSIASPISIFVLQQINLHVNKNNCFKDKIVKYDFEQLYGITGEDISQLFVINFKWAMDFVVRENQLQHPCLVYN